MPFVLGSCVVLLAFFAFNKSINNKLDITDRENISTITTQEQVALNRLIRNITISLITIAKDLQALAATPEKQMTFLTNLEKNHSSTLILMANAQGKATRSSQEIVDVSTSTVFLEAMKGKITATEIHTSRVTAHDVVTIGVPMRHGDTVTGALIIEYNTKFIKRLLTAYTSSGDSAYLFDSTGHTVASSSKIYNSLNFLQKAHFDNGMTYAQFLDFATRTRWGSAVFTFDGEKRIIEFRPLDINSWLFFRVSRDILANPVRNISKELIMLASSMFFLFLLLSAYIIFLKRKTLQEVKAIAFYDELTKLHNIVKFKQEVEKVIKKTPNMKYVMQMIDLENFTAINEMFDYETGNLVIKKIAIALTSMNDDSFLCARMGNDKFIMFSVYGFLDDDKIRDAFESRFRTLLPELNTYEFCFRYGRYFIQKGDRDVTDMINKTTLAHSKAKSLGHMHTWDYDDTFRQEVRRRTELINMSKSALENKEFIVYFQPKYNLKQEKVTGGEALVRWIMDKGDMLLPEKFIPVFEQNGFVVAIDFFVLNTVCMRIKSWIEKGHKVLPISVNFSRVHLKNPHFVEHIKDVCDVYGDIRHFIEVEFTETAITENAADLTKLLDELHEAGFTVAIDDFGAGYSSLGMLKDFKVDVLKLDQSFFANSQGNKRGSIVVNGISAIAHDLNMSIVAEGIELSEHFEPLDADHLELAQGFFFARPMPMEEFEQRYFD